LNSARSVLVLKGLVPYLSSWKGGILFLERIRN
jgi:hypothetical protein